VARRDLLLVELTSDGLRRLGLTRGELLEFDARSYPQTAAWARALHEHCARVDGLLWVTRQRATSRALLLFGDRVKVSELASAPGEVRLTLGAGEGERRSTPPPTAPASPSPVWPSPAAPEARSGPAPAAHRRHRPAAPGLFVPSA
jgi:RES domain